VDGDVIHTYREFAESGRAQGVQEAVLKALKDGGKIFFTGCGSTGRLSIQLVSIWRDFWQRQRARGLKCSPSGEEFENRAFSVMAGGDYALIKAVEGFEDFTNSGKANRRPRDSSKGRRFRDYRGGENFIRDRHGMEGRRGGRERFILSITSG